MSASRAAKARITRSFSLEGIRPCSSSTRSCAPSSGNSSVRSRSYSSVAARDCTASEPSTSGQMTNTCRPASISPRAWANASRRSIGVRYFVTIGVRPGGISSITERSRSPYSVSASERGIGVADIASRCGVSVPPREAALSAPLRRRSPRCITPKRCCSSTTASPRRW